MDYLERSWTLTESWVMASQLVDIPSQPRDQGTVGANTEVEKENNSHGLHRETRGRTRRRQSSSLSPGKGTTDGASTPSIFVILFNLHKTSTKWALLVSFLQKKKLNIQNNQVIAKRQIHYAWFPNSRSVACFLFVCFFTSLRTSTIPLRQEGSIELPVGNRKCCHGSCWVTPSGKAAFVLQVVNGQNRGFCLWQMVPECHLPSWSLSK